MFNSFTTVQLPVSCPSLTASYICHHSMLPTFNLFFRKYQLSSNDANVLYYCISTIIDVRSNSINSYCTILSSTSYYPWYCRFYCCPTTTWVSMTWIYSPMIVTNVWINKGRFVDNHLFLSAKVHELGSPSCSVEGRGIQVEGSTLFRHSITIPPKPYISPRQDQVDGWVRLDLASFVSI